MEREEIIEKLKKFTQDPDWVLAEELMLKYMEPLRSLSNIDSKRSNDEIASDVRGRQLALDSLTKFLNDTKIVSSNKINSKPQTFK